MAVLGVHAQSAGSRFLVHFALVDSATVQWHDDYAAPVGEDEAGQLHELAVRAGQILDRHKPDLIALKHAELTKFSKTQDALAIPMHAEAVVLAAVGERQIPFTKVASPTLRGCLPQGSSPRSNQAAVEYLCAELQGAAGLGGQATAAAVARFVSR